ncbi:MAG TPA: ABC transporter permease [Alphaproteobacteria bacterium]
MVSRRGNDHARLFSWGRLWAVTLKEFVQMRRDRLTFAMMVVIPIVQLVLFGYAINTNPRQLPTAALVQDSGVHVRSLLAALRNTGYFDVTHVVRTEDELDYLIAAGRVQFAVQIPPGFERDLQRGDRPQLLVVADASDPTATGNALAALDGVARTALRRDLVGPVHGLTPAPAPFEIVVHRRYNPAGDTRLNIVPGLLGIVLTMTMLIFTALSMTREVERGTMETLLATPLRPVEVMMGKIIPYVFVGFVQMAVILVSAFLLFDVPVEGSLALLMAFTVLFIVANLSIGYTFSTVARNQLQAVQMSFFFFLPNMLLSGFMFPFRGMPGWAQVIGEALPLTHFLRIVRAIMLKGGGLDEVYRDVLALAAFTLAVLLLALARFRRTLD